MVKIFNTRLKLLTLYLEDQGSADCQRVIQDLRSQIAQIPTDAFSVQRIYRQIEQAWGDSFWRYLTKQKIEFLKTQVAPLLRFASNVDVAAATFTNKVERLKTEILEGNPKPATLESIAEDVSYLPDFVHEDPKLQQSIQICLSARLRSATVPELTQIVADLAEQMKNRRERPSSFVEIDLADQIATRGFITLGDGGEQVYVEEYRQRVETKILELVVVHPTIEAIERGERVTDLQLIALERSLKQELGSGSIQLTQGNIRKAFDMKVTSLLGFLRELLDLREVPDYEAIVQRNFEQHIAQRQYNANQIRFLRAVQSVFLQKRRLEMADLYEEPLNRFGEDVVERWFTEEQVQEILNLIEQLAA
ncbi:type I restriction-modification enzyme R subunit C-terminal domain-containing protein [Leptolyngbya sp. AN03gr2]|uniref:type I restriction-modification enzyme R subunit C-terminal domain-containing protein n=1 Tax=unclassified Leptolyngbya TaxID=2650499 RepID=UPI003D319220